MFAKLSAIPAAALVANVKSPAKSNGPSTAARSRMFRSTRARSSVMAIVAMHPAMVKARITVRPDS